MSQSRLLSVVSAVILVFLGWIPSAAAQPDSLPGSVDVSRLGRVCWRKVLPAPRCRAWVVTEFTWEHPVAFTEFADQGFRRDDFKPRFGAAIGPMFNHRPNAAIGAIFAFNPNEYGMDLLRAEGRYRRWLGSRTGVDIGIGYAHARVPAGAGLDDIIARGATAGIGVEYAWVGLDVRHDWLNGGGRPRHATLAGVHTSSSGTGMVWAIGTILGVIGIIASADDEG